MGWLIDYINTYDLWNELSYSWCQIRSKMTVIELIDYIYNEPVTNHLKYHYWEQLNILEVNNGRNT